MTTIAWDGRFLVADRQATDGYGHKRDASKILPLKDGRIFAGCGDWWDVQRVHQYLNGVGSKPESKDSAGTIGMLWAPKEGRMHTVASVGGEIVMMPITESRFAIGSGREYALAAMACGKNAAEAVEIAHVFDAFTGPRIDVFDLKRKAKR